MRGENASASPSWPDELGQRIYTFAVRALRIADAIPSRRIASRVLGKQLLRSATSVAANFEETRGAISYADFIAKISAAYKECRESVLWLRLIRDAALLPAPRLAANIDEATQLRAILGTTPKTARQNRQARSRL